MRLFVPEPLASGVEMPLPEGPARHAMVRRVQPGDALTLFDGGGSDWPATVLAVTRSGVRVLVGLPQPVARELPVAVTVAAVMPANERMDLLVEKATELGVARIQPLHAERSVLRLAGDRAERKHLHWQAVAQAACEQCGRAVVPQLGHAGGHGHDAGLADDVARGVRPAVRQELQHQLQAGTGQRGRVDMTDGAHLGRPDRGAMPCGLQPSDPRGRQVAQRRLWMPSLAKGVAQHIQARTIRRAA